MSTFHARARRPPLPPSTFSALACARRSAGILKLLTIRGLLAFRARSNWKANGNHTQVRTWLASLNGGKTAPSTEVVVAPPFPYLSEVKARLRTDFAVAAQDAHATTGAHTGEVSASMLKDLGLKYTILGHSERRQKGETNEFIAAKATAAIDNGLTVIACLGETAAEREAGRTMDVVTGQLAVRAHAG